MKALILFCFHKQIYQKYDDFANENKGMVGNILNIHVWM